MDDAKPNPPAPPADAPPDGAVGAKRKRPAKPTPLHTAFWVVGLVLVCAWVYWWAITFNDMKLLAGRKLWIPAWSFIGLDFVHHYFAVPYWLKGGNVYLEQFGDPIAREYAYPPIMLPLFLWVVTMGPKAATIVWTLGSAAVFAYAAWGSARVRQSLRLFDPSKPFIIGAVLLSMPVMFHLERGNSDVVVLLMVLFVAALLAWRKSWLSDLLIGACLAVATWTKLYPAILLPGMLVLGRPRAFVLGGLMCAGIGLAMWDPIMDWVTRSRAIVRDYPMVGTVFAHSISGSWKYVWWEYDLPWLRRIPGLVGASFLLLPLTLWGSWHVFRCPQQKKLVYAFLLWLSTVGTFWFPISMDYKLFFLPLVVAALWDVRDRLLVHAFIGVMLLWWQPYRITSIPPWHLLLFKVLGLVGVTISLVARARELGQPDPFERELAPGGSGGPAPIPAAAATAT